MKPLPRIPGHTVHDHYHCVHRLPMCEDNKQPLAVLPPPAVLLEGYRYLRQHLPGRVLVKK